MGPGILIRHAKGVLGGLAIILVVLGILVFGMDSGGTEFESVNDLPNQSEITFLAEQETYAADAGEIQLEIRNDAADGSLVLKDFAFALEIQEDGEWKTLEPVQPDPEWIGEDGAEGQIAVEWNGGELELTCPVGTYYEMPLESGTYRIVLPECEFGTSAAALAAEFTVE